MFKTLAAVATLAVAVVAQDKPLWEQPEIPTECQGDCIGMLKFQSKCAKADLTCLVELCTDPDTVKKCLTCAKADVKSFEDGCRQVEESKKNGVTEIPTGTAADAIAESAAASQSAAKAGGDGKDASASPTQSGGNAPSGSASAAPAGNAAGSASGNAASSVSSAVAGASGSAKADSAAGKLAPAALVGAAGILAALI